MARLFKTANGSTKQLTRWLTAFFIQQLFIHVIATGTESEPPTPTAISVPSLPTCDPGTTWSGGGHCAPSGALVTFGQTSFGSGFHASGGSGATLASSTAGNETTWEVSNSTNATSSSKTTGFSITETGTAATATSGHKETHSETTVEDSTCSTTSLTASNTMNEGSILTASSDGSRLNARFPDFFRRLNDGKALIKRLIMGWSIERRQHGDYTDRDSCVTTSADGACERAPFKEVTRENNDHFARDESTTSSARSASLTSSRNITSSKTVTQTFIVSPVPPPASNLTTSPSAEGDQPLVATTDGTADAEVKSCTRAVKERRGVPVTIPYSCFAYEPLSSEDPPDAATPVGSATSQVTGPPSFTKASTEATSTTNPSPLTSVTETQENHNSLSAQPTAEPPQPSIPAKSFSTLPGVATTAENSPASFSQVVALLTTATTTISPTRMTITESRRDDINGMQTVGCTMPSGSIEGRGLGTGAVECSMRRTVTVTERVCPAQGFI